MMKEINVHEHCRYKYLYETVSSIVDESYGEISTIDELLMELEKHFVFDNEKRNWNEIPESEYMADDGYPSDELLIAIAECEIDDYSIIPKIAEIIASIWNTGEGILKIEENGNLLMWDGGWSGNEDIIYAIRHNFLLSVCLSENGSKSQYEFDVNRFRK